MMKIYAVHTPGCVNQSVFRFRFVVGIFRLETSKRISNLFGHQGFLQVILKTIDAMESSPKSHKRKEAYMLMFLLMMIFFICTSQPMAEATEFHINRPESFFKLFLFNVDHKLL
ncbi:hypothetical protein Hanom_Chr03g00273401 [Helianthus anomalus]